MSDAASYAGIRVTLLGATGFVGQWVARALRARGATLHLIARDPVRLGELRRANALDVSAAVGDLSDANAVRTLIAGGSRMGLKHGNYWRSKETRMSNVHLSILHSMGIEVETFSDSTSTATSPIFT